MNRELDPERLRSLLNGASIVSVHGDEGRFRTVETVLTPAAILFPIIVRATELHVLLTRRTNHLKNHAGQISFPGGRVEPDDKDAVETALREAEEETGLARSQIEVIGCLPPYQTKTGFSITPVVALIYPPFSLSIDRHEVAEAFEVPLAFLLNRSNYRQHSLVYQGRRRHYLAIPYRDYYIWGATAAMIASLEHLLDCPQAA